MALLIEEVEETGEGIAVLVDRHTLYKRRWRGTAVDGTELAVALVSPAKNGQCLVGKNGERFVIEQTSEMLVSIPLPQSTKMAAQVGWYLGNQHLPVEVREGEILLEELETLKASLTRIGIPFKTREDVFNCKMHSHRH